jgi:predicted MFS family arabinose efflux permease
MIGWKNKWVYFALEALNSFACSFFFNFLFFFLRDNYHFGNRENLAITAFHGLIYTIASWQGGKFIEKNGQIRSLKIGFIGMIIFLVCGIPFSSPLPALLIILLGWTVSMCLIWPAIESLVSLNEPSKELPRMVGIYNAVWAGSSAIAYFVGGAFYEHLGWKSLFWIPLIIHIIQLILLKIFANKKHQLVSEPNNNESEQSESKPNIPDKSPQKDSLKWRGLQIHLLMWQ